MSTDSEDQQQLHSSDQLSIEKRLDAVEEKLDEIYMILKVMYNAKLKS